MHTSISRVLLLSLVVIIGSSKSRFVLREGTHLLKKTTMHLETSRLFITPFCLQDIDVWAEIEANVNVRKYIDGRALTKDQAATYVREQIESYRLHGFGRYAVRLQSTGALIGMCGFMVEPYGIDFGYRLSESHWQQGYGYEAAKAVLDFGLIKLSLKKVIAVAFKANLASIKIIENLDFIAQGPIMFSGFTVEKYILTRNNVDG